MTTDAKQDQHEILLAAHKRAEWLRENFEVICWGQGEFQHRRDKWRLACEARYYHESGVVTANTARLLDRPIRSSRDSMRSIRAQERLEKDGLIERLRLDGARNVNFLKITQAGEELAKTLSLQSDAENPK